MNTDVSASEFRVVRVIAPDTVVIAGGTRQGIKNHDRFLVLFKEDEELLDPESGLSLGQLEIVRGTAIAVHVQENLTTIRSDRTKSNGRIVTKRTTRSNSSVMASLLALPETTEEFTDIDVVPFENVELRDIARRIQRQ